VRRDFAQFHTDTNMSRDASPVRALVQKNTVKKAKKTKCTICSFKCAHTKNYKERLDGDEDIDSDFADRLKNGHYCCRCVIAMDGMIWNESGDEQCSECEGSTRSCIICDRDDCDVLETYGKYCANYADEDGYYCCLHVEHFCESYNSDRFSVRGYGTECDTCKHLVADTDDQKQRLKDLDVQTELCFRLINGGIKKYKEAEKKRIRMQQSFFVPYNCTGGQWEIFSDQ